ncbi:MAG: hypothetical protein N2C14_13865 [Planctomycetales bacterium]
MSRQKKEIRAAFRAAVFQPDRYRCRVCGLQSSPEKAAEQLDAHHITDRHEIANGGYVKENGVSLCKAKCHVLAESHHNGETPPNGFSPSELYNRIGSSLARAERASEKLG